MIPAEVTGEPVTQLAFEVITTVTTFPFAKVDVVKVEAVSPEISLPFTRH